MALASSAVTLGRSNVAAAHIFSPRPGRSSPYRVPLFGLAHLGQPDEIHELRERGQLLHRPAGVPARAISCSIRRMAAVAASRVLMGKITIR